MSADLENHSVALERLSALVDGELDAVATATACGHWREASALRASWHEYHLIGDLLRSDDLASTASRDASFLDALRLRLAEEPVVLAPQPLPSVVTEAPVVRVANGGRGGRWSWMASSAVAAGFVAVAGVVMVTQGPGAPPASSVVAEVAQEVKAPAPAGTKPVSATTLETSTVVPEPQVLIANGKLIRDARLDRYLSAHQQFAGSSALGVPSAFLRSATADASNR